MIGHLPNVATKLITYGRKYLVGARLFLDILMWILVAVLFGLILLFVQINLRYNLFDWSK